MSGKYWKYQFWLPVLLLFTTCKKDSAGCLTAGGNTISEIRETTGYWDVEVGQRITVELVMMPSGKLIVEAPENFMKYIHTEVDGATLKIYETIGCGWNQDFDREIRVKFLAPSVGSLIVNDAARLVCDTCYARRLNVKMNSTSPMNLNFSGGFLTIDHNSVGPITLRGQVGVFVPTIYDAGKLDARDFTGDFTFLYHYGNNEAHVRPLKELYVEIGNEGNAYYYAEPRDKPVELKKTGGGNLFRAF